MTARRAFFVIISVTLAGSAAYVFVYLYRWEWHRALMAGVLFVAAEVALVGAAIFDRLRGQASQRRPSDRGETLEALRQAAPPPPTPFACPHGTRTTWRCSSPCSWGPAWSCPRSPGWSSASPARPRTRCSNANLATRLAPLAPPDGGFLGQDDERLTLLHTPSGGGP
jgi:hypothetical protein